MTPQTTNSREKQRYMLTAALPYANGPVHIGHLAGVYVPADIFARYMRLKGEDVLFVCGSDEHGVPVTIRARNEGISVQEVVDKYHALIKKSFQGFGISFDIYSRTSTKVHAETASAFFEVLYDKNKFIEKESDQFFDEKANQFLSDRYIQGTCPNCGNPDAYGDQCERCGSTLSPQELGNPRSMLSGAKPIMKPTKHWYLPLGDYENWLREWILEGHKADWKTNVYGQCKSWIEQGLNPRPMTRDLDWGVPVPLPNAEGKVLYVWFDAPIGYISATKEYFIEKGTPDEWQKYWKDQDTKLVHFIGKDNIVFHCITFPVMLHAHGEFILPDNVPANEFLNLENEKISTSRNWAVWLHEYLEQMPEKQDVLRYVLTANAPETSDNNFMWANFQERNNSDLVGKFGNYFNRALVLTQQNFGDKIPNVFELQDVDKKLIADIALMPKKIEKALENYHFREAVGYLIEVSEIGNKYLQENEPWKLAKGKDDKSTLERLSTIMHLALQVAANLAILSEPFLPFTSDKMKKMLQIDTKNWQDTGKLDVLDAQKDFTNEGLLFEKIENDVIKAQLERLENIKKTNLEAQKNKENAEKQPEPPKGEITYDDFGKLDIRIATIKSAERMPKSDKLLKITLDTGIDTRIVLSGIGKSFAPEQIIGQQVCLLANLAPRKMMGEISNGMILMAENQDGTLAFVAPSKAVWNGGKVS